MGYTVTALIQLVEPVSLSSDVVGTNWMPNSEHS